MKNLQNNKRISLLVILLSATGLLPAQDQFMYKADIPKAATSGFYSIKLQPGFIAKSQDNYTDIRLSDHNNNFQPYLFRNELSTGKTTSFIPLPPAAVNNNSGSDTTYTVENTSGLSISELSLFLRNTAVQRTVNVLGSDDNRKWFAIKENVVIQPVEYNSNNNYEQKINFPASNYRYIKIQLNETGKAPVNIIQAGIYTPAQGTVGYEELPVSGFTQKDSAGTSIVTLQLPEAYQINKLHLNIAGARFYQRNAAVYAIINQNQVFISDLTIASAGLQGLPLAAKTSQLKIYIQNGDNPPLQIQSVKAWQENISLVAWLEQGEHYQLLTGNLAATQPDYDLRFFKDSIQSALPVITHDKIAGNPLYKAQTSSKSKEPASWIIWLAIGVALAVLTLLSLKMAKEIGKSKTQP